MCIVAIYDKKDSVNTGKTKKCRWLHLDYGIRVSYFWSGKANFCTFSLIAPTILKLER